MPTSSRDPSAPSKLPMVTSKRFGDVFLLQVHQNCRGESFLPEGSYAVSRRKWCHTSMRIREQRLARDWDAILCIAWSNILNYYDCISE